MSEPEEYRSDLLDALISEALENEGSRPDREGQKSQIETLFTFGEPEVYEHVYRVLSGILPRAELVLALQELKEQMLSSYYRASIKELHSLIKNLKVKQQPKEPLWNITDPHVVFVTGNPPYDSGSSTRFVESLKKSGFSSRHCAWTYLNRCGTDEPVDWEKYLFSELRIWAPKLIVCLGADVFKALTGLNEYRITEEHGQVCWVGPWAIACTFSPQYAEKASKFSQLEEDLDGFHQFCFGDFIPSQ